MTSNLCSTCQEPSKDPCFACDHQIICSEGCKDMSKFYHETICTYCLLLHAEMDDESDYEDQLTKLFHLGRMDAQKSRMNAQKKSASFLDLNKVPRRNGPQFIAIDKLRDLYQAGFESFIS